MWLVSACASRTLKIAAWGSTDHGILTIDFAFGFRLATIVGRIDTIKPIRPIGLGHRRYNHGIFHRHDPKRA